MKIKRFSPKQKRVMCWWGPKSADRHCDAIICDGAVRSGKTLCMGLSFVCWTPKSCPAKGNLSKNFLIFWRNLKISQNPLAYPSALYYNGGTHLCRWRI